MIVGTAGHIDHGKTTLVQALTGVDTDRLPEEKRRGITLELGYAFLDAPDHSRIGFIDVPGHERLVHTMLAGASGIDLALLLVAADDGVMPQTREHLAVLSLLGIRRGFVVVTKCDRVDADRVASVCAEAAALLDGTALAGSTVLPVSAQRGNGVDALKAQLFAAARETARDANDGRAFRLAIDRAFSLDGIGTVVTGTVHAGCISVGDELCLVPGAQVVRVRSLHAQNLPVQEALAGQRCAIGLGGMDRSRISRGQWLVAPGVALSTDRIDVDLTVWQGESRPLRSGTPVHVHLGSASVMGSVAVLDPPTLAPGETGRVQLVMRQPIGGWHGDRVVLRDASASRALAGGTVLDPFAPVRYRRTPQRLMELAALQATTVHDRLHASLASAQNGLDVRRYLTAQGVTRSPLVNSALLHSDAHGDWALGHAQLTEARGKVLAALADFHAAHPEELGPDGARLRRWVSPRMAEPLWRALLSQLQQDGSTCVRGAFVHLAEHGVRLSATEARLAQKVAPMLAAAGFEGAWVRDLAHGADEPEPLARIALARLAQRGELFQVVKDLYYRPDTMAALTVIARRVAAAHDGEVLAAQFRDATGLGRKRAIQILEHFDRIGLLRRVGDVHRLRTECTLFLETSP